MELAETSVVGTSVIDQNSEDSFASLATVVDQEQIRDLNALDLSSALRRTPGVVVSRFTRSARSAVPRAAPCTFAEWTLVAPAARSRPTSTAFRFT